MKTHLLFIGAMSLLGTSFLSTGYAVDNSEYLHFTRHRDSNGNLLMGPTHHQAEPSVMQKTIMPSQPKSFERRSTDWGMSVQEVKENEPVQSSWELQSPVLADSEQRVAYHTQIEGIEAALTYTFYEDHLGQAKYVFEPQHADAVEFVKDFHTVEHWISQSYGPPTFVQEIWLDTLYQYDKSLWGQAVKRGHLVMVAEWKNPGTNIVLVLDGGEDTVGLVADFSSSTFMVPVSLNLHNQEKNAEVVIDETPIQEGIAIEPTGDSLGEDSSGKNMTNETEGSGLHHETRVNAPGLENEMDELNEIEELPNNTFPLNEPLNKEFPLSEPLNKEFPYEAKVNAPGLESGMDEIEELPNNTFPLNEPLNKEFPLSEPLNKEFPINKSVEPEMELDPQHL